MSQYKRLLVPVDGTYLSERAIHASIDLARQLGAAITGFVAEPVMPAPAVAHTDAWLEDDARAHDAITETRARQVLADFERRAATAGVPFEGYYERVPRIDQAIVDTAESKGCDLIVMVTHGRGAFGEFLFGSQTKAVLAGSRLPLLVLH